MLQPTGSNIRTSQPLAVVMGAGGLAMAVARRMGDTYRVLIVDRDQSVLERGVARLREEGHDAFGEIADVTDIDAIERVAERAHATGPVAALSHVVGVSARSGDAATVLRVNLRGAALSERAFRPILEPGSAAVFIASLAAHLGEPSDAVASSLDDPFAADLVERVTAAVGEELTSTLAYQLSKWALIRMVRRAATDWGRQNLRIVSLSPGLIATPQGKIEFANPAKQALYAKSPLQREGTMIEIADVVEFLHSHRASFIHGTDILVDGGMKAAVVTESTDADAWS